MYNEEYLPDDAVLDVDNMSISIDGSSSMDSEEVERKKTAKLYKLTDPDYYYYKKTEYDEEGYIRRRNVEIYSSPSAGPIRNAPTGIRESDRVGSLEEDLYFRVKDVGLYTKTERNGEPRKLFYRNPEEFERHFGITLPYDIKNAWHQKFMRAQARLQH